MSTESGTPLPSQAPTASAASELNNLLQIISATSSLAQDGGQTKEERDKYLEMLKTSIERAEAVAAELTAQAGGVTEKSILPAELAPFMRQKKRDAGSHSGKQSILVVDDEQMTLTLLKRILAEGGYNVVTAQSGFECLDQFRRRPYIFELVLLDLTMPFMDGEEAFQRLREIREDIPVLLCTGFVAEERLKRLLDAGLTGFMRKPIAPGEIMGVVRSTLQTVRYSQSGRAGTGTIPAAL